MMLIELKTGIPQKWHKCQVAAYAYLLEKNYVNGEFIKVSGFRREETDTTEKYHEYHYGEKKLISVSEVCQTFQTWTPRDILAMKLGTKLHEYCELIDRGHDDWNFIDEISKIDRNFLNKIKAYRKFKKDYQIDWINNIQNEIALCDFTLGFAGTFDKFISGPGDLQAKILYLKEKGDYSIVHLNQRDRDYYFHFFKAGLRLLKNPDDSQAENEVLKFR